MKIRGHETFSIRKGWLHKGVKNISNEPRLFTRKDINPCDLLGIGTNMVKALRYWMNAVGIMKEEQDGSQKKYLLTELGEIIDQNDKYYEEDGTKWAVHYRLATNREQATAWYWFFNVFKLNSFDKDIFVKELGEYLAEEYKQEDGYSDKVLADEFDCIIRTYCAKEKDINPEDVNICPLTELHLIEHRGGKDYKKYTPDRDTIPPLIIFGAICELNENEEILISDLMEKPLNIAKIFNLDRTTCFYYLDKLQKMGLLSLSRTAGLDVIRLKNKYSFNEALTKYYKELKEGNING